MESKQVIELAFGFIIAIILFVPHKGHAQGGRFVYEGNGKISIRNLHTGKSARVSYRNGDGTYSTQAISQINQVFGMPAKKMGEDASLRLIAFLDYLEDRFSPGSTLFLLSGYRTESANNRLRRRGRPAAKTSYHLDGMAADVVFPGASASEIWKFARSLKCCGAGYYNDRAVHIDSGKPRFWTFDTAVPKKRGHAPNKNIYLATDLDIYRSGETLRLFLSAVSDYPFGIKAPLKLIRKRGRDLTIYPQFHNSQTLEESHCHAVKNKKDARQIYWKIPEDFSFDSALNQIQMTFCGHNFKTMPSKILSRPFKIQRAP